MTQSQFAELLDVDVTTVAGSESKKIPGKGFLRKVSMLAIEHGKHHENQVFMNELEQRVMKRKIA